MGWKRRDAVICHSRHTGTTYLVLKEICDYTPDDGDWFDKSMAWLARRMRLHVNTVRRAVRELEESGDLTSVDKGPGKPKGYILRDQRPPSDLLFQMDSVDNLF